MEGDAGDVARVDWGRGAECKWNPNLAVAPDHRRPLQGIGHEAPGPQQRPIDAAGADRFLRLVVPAGDRVVHIIAAAAQHRELDDMANTCRAGAGDRKSTRLNSSHLGSSYAV